MNWKGWIKGLGAAVISSAATAVGSLVTAPDIVQEVGWVAIARISLGGAVVALAAYLKRSPLPGQGGEE